MSKNDALSGEEKLKQRTRYYIFVVIMALIIGLIVGFSLAFFDMGDGNIFTGAVNEIILPPAISIALAIGFLIGLVIWPIYSFRTVDELEERINFIGTTAGFYAMLGAYPIWQCLAAGGFAEQPQPFAIFLTGFGVTMVTYIVLKFKNR